MTKPAQSSSFSCEWTYDVFISFRGEDTRTSFTGHLYNALKQKGIQTFIDDEELKRGEEITPSLLKAIKESRMAIIVFSENYASSRYCLDELVHILEYLKGKDRLVWPVFYHVEPSQVRHQTGSYGEALARHEDKFKDSRDKVQKWRLALSEAANLSGYALEQGNEYEYKFIGRIIEEISVKINRIPLHVTDCPVGLESRVLEVNSLLDVGSNSGVNMVGICGIGGIGKTTIARAVCNLIGDQFEGLCFLSNVREVSDKHGLSHLQETLLTEILGENIKLGDVNRGVSIIKRRLCQKKVLLILDDVDKPEQLQATAGRCDWFGCGSRIIITTRDKHLLASHEVERIYVVKELNHKEAIQLFSWKAFRKDEVHSSFLGISRRVVDYCSGLPLALEVIGSNFYAKSIDEWDCALREYERIPDSKILKVLKLTYDALEDNEKEIFLDVACFFKGDTFEDVKDRLLSVRDIKSEYALGVLIDKSLIKIEYGRVTMHDLIEDMGKEIIRQESPKEPGGRSRLWFYQDILHVLQENTKFDCLTDMNLSNCKFLKQVPDLSGVPNLRKLCLDGCPSLTEIHDSVGFLGELRELSAARCTNLRTFPRHIKLPFLECLELSRCSSLQCFPEVLEEMGNLTLLYLSGTAIEELPYSIRNLTGLQTLELEECKFLRQLPDLSGVSNLRWLRLDGCPNLTEIHDSIGFLGELRLLSAERCTNLKTFPRCIKLPFRECLELSRCSSLQCFPEELKEMGNLPLLNLSWTAIEELPYSIRNLTGLQTLYLMECKFLRQVPDLFGVPNLQELCLDGCPSLTEIHDSVGFLGKLRVLSAERCTNLNTFPRRIKLPFLECLKLSRCSSLQCFSEVLEEMGNLTRLYLSGTAIEELPYSIRNLTGLETLDLKECKFLRRVPDLFGVQNLRRLYLDGCPSLIEIHDSVGFLGELRVLSAKHCTNLKTFPRRIKLPFLECLELSWCSSLQYFPEVLEEMRNIIKLDLSGTTIEELPYSIRNLTGLQTLDWKKCNFLSRVPDLSGVPKLRKLCLNGCSSLTEIHDPVGFLGELRLLSVVYCTNLRTFPRHIKLPFLECLELSWCSSLQCFPEVLEEMGNLTLLDLSGTAIEELPYSIRYLTRLETLNLKQCKLLRRVPDLSRVPNLQKLCLDGCPSLTEIHDSVGFLGELRELSVVHCTNLKTFPRRIKLPFLECLKLSWCSSLRCFPEVLEEMENLILLDLSMTAIEELPYSIRYCTGLETLNLSQCKLLRRVPDLTGVPNLQKLCLDGCLSLTEIHDSVGFLGELRELCVVRCTNLETFPRRIKFPFLEYLELSWCSSLQCFPEVLEEMGNLTQLDLSGTAIEELPYSIRNLTGLEALNLKECNFLRRVPDLSGVPNLRKLCLDGCPSLSEIHDAIGFLGELRKLNVVYCTNLRTFPRHIKLPFLECLELSWCSSLQCFPEVLEEMGNLTLLDLSGTAIEELPHSICYLTGLETLNLKECKLLRRVPDLSGVPYLQKLCLDGCPSLIEIHDSVSFLGELRVLSAERCTNLKTFPRRIKLPFLECLELSWCSSLQYFPEVLEEMKNITKLGLSGTAIQELPYSICNLIGLQTLYFTECKLIKQLPTSVLKLCLSYFPNLTDLDLSFNSFTILPACIEKCDLLRNLYVKSCKQLRQIGGMPPNLAMFIAENCTSLTSLSSSKFLNQVFQWLEIRSFMWSWGIKFIFPGQEVPKWFDHYSNGESVSFWVRKEFPPIVVCVVVGVLDNRDSSSINVALCMRVNGTDEEELSYARMTSTIETDHICLFGLRNQFLQVELLKSADQDKWYHIEVLCKSEPLGFERVVKCCGVHVYKQLTRTENIQFSRPSSPKRTCHELYHSNNDLKLGCSPLMKKQHTSLDMGDCDCESQDIQHQRCLALVPTSCETVSKHKGKDLSVYNEGSEWLSMRPWWQETLAFVNCDSNSMKSASTSDTISDQGFERGAVKCCGVHVYKQLNSMENIQFSRPSSSKRTYHELYNSNNDLKLGCSPLMKKQHTSLDVGDCDCESRDIQHQRCLALVATGCETVSKHKGKDLSMYNDGSEWLSMRPCGQETLAFMNWNSNSMKSASTSDTISDQDVIVLDHPGPAKSQRKSLSSNIGGKLHQTTSSTALPTITDGSSRNRIEPTPDDIEMEAFYGSLDDEETQRAIETLQDLLSKDFPVLLDQGLYSTMKSTLEYLSNLSVDGGVREEMRSVILELSRGFAHWSRDYGDASRKIELITSNLLKADKLEEDLGINKKHFREVKDTVAKREIYEKGKTLKAQRDELRQQVPHLRDEQESAINTQAKIKAEWSKLAEKFNNIKSQNCQN